MPYEWLYEDDTPDDQIIASLVACLSDEAYQAAALAKYAASGEPLDPYVLVSESAAWREDMETPALLVKDVTSEDEDDEPRMTRTLRLSVYQMLSGDTTREGEAALMREAYRRTAAVAAMIRSARQNGFDLFAGTNVTMGKHVQVKRRAYGDTMPGKASYFRFPSVDVEIKFEEAN